jgi:hypothetical protein
MKNTRSYGTTGDWLVGAARRNPEALLVIAAGCALLLRKGSSLMSNGSSYEHTYDDSEEDFESDRPRSHARGAVSEAISGATEYVSDVSSRVYDTASSYASTAAEYAQEGRRQAARLSSRAQSTASQVWREQPFAVAGLGLAAGAAVAALLPPTRTERRVFVQASEALVEAGGRTIESAKEAAGQVAERLQGGAAEIGAAGVREIAREAAQTFVGSVSGNASAAGSRNA